jgi:hypothetical protein
LHVVFACYSRIARKMAVEQWACGGACLVPPAPSPQPLNIALAPRAAMQTLCAEHFDREIACSEAEWLSCLPRAIGSHPYRVVAKAASIKIGPGQLALSWRTCTAPGASTHRQHHLLVSFRHSGLDDAQRYLFMRQFEAHLPQRMG